MPICCQSKMSHYISIRPRAESCFNIVMRGLRGTLAGDSTPAATNLVQLYSRRSRATSIASTSTNGSGGSSSPSGQPLHCEQERLPRGGPSFEPLVGALDSRQNEKPTKLELVYSVTWIASDQRCCRCPILRGGSETTTASWSRCVRV